MKILLKKNQVMLKEKSNNVLINEISLLTLS
jgi:hypothetical protein